MWHRRCAWASNVLTPAFREHVTTTGGRMSLSKEDRKVPQEARLRVGPARPSTVAFQEAIAAALHREFGDTHAAIKTVVSLTGAHERAVKNWFSGRNGPSGAFVVALCRHSEEVFNAVLLLAGREAELKVRRVLTLKKQLRTLFELINDGET
jgi:hypothetical protein